MALGKRLSATDAIAVASVVGLDRRLTYDEFVALFLNLPTVQAADDFHAAVAVAVGSGQPMPYEWIDAAVDDSLEAAKWRMWDLRRTFGP